MRRGNRGWWPRETGCPRVARLACWLLLLSVVCPRRCHSVAFDNVTDPFVQKCQMECGARRDFATCGKYKVARWLNTLVREKEFNYGSFRVIRIPSMHKQSFLPNLPHSRAFKSDITEVLNFIRDSVEDLLTKRAIVYTIDNNSAIGRGFSSSLMVMDDDEIKKMQNKEDEGNWRIFKKKKTSIILPVLILLNLFKLKLLLLPIFLGVHFIKKLLVLGSLILPSVLAHLKVCKVHHTAHHNHHTHPYHVWGTAAEASVDYPSGYAQDDSTWHRNDYQLSYPGFQIFRNPYG